MVLLVLTLYEYLLFGAHRQIKLIHKVKFVNKYFIKETINMKESNVWRFLYF